MSQGWTIDAAADTIRFLQSVPNTSTVTVREYATASLNATATWAVGAWNDRFGYPSVVEFYSDRLGGAATLDQPQTVWFSRTGDYSFFGKSTPITDDDPFAATMNARQLNTITDIIPKQDLLVATAGGIWKIGNSDEALTPETVGAKPQPSVGAGSLRGLDTGDSFIYVSHKGGQVRDLTYTFEADGYAGSDLTAFAAHLLRGHRIASWAWCPEPWSAVFAVRDDGVLLIMTYKREHQVVAWSRRPTQGRFTQVEAIPEGDTYGVYVCVEREGYERDGEELIPRLWQYVERLADPVYDDMREEIGVDCALTYDGRNTSATFIDLSGGAAAGDPVTITAGGPGVFAPSNVGDEIVIDYDGTPCRIRILSYTSASVVTGVATRPLATADLTPGAAWALAVDTLSGLEHLEGLTVRAAGDGFDLGTYTVENGAITLSTPAFLAHVGLDFDAEFESLDMAIAGGSTIASRQKLVRAVGILLHNTAAPIRASATGFTRMETIKARDSNMAMSVPAERRTEWVDVNVDGGWKQNPRIFIRAPGPYGARILAIEPEFEVGT